MDGVPTDGESDIVARIEGRRVVEPISLMQRARVVQACDNVAILTADECNVLRGTKSRCHAITSRKKTFEEQYRQCEPETGINAI